MKRISFFCLAIFALAQISLAQSKVKPEEIGAPCPDGQCPIGGSIVIDHFNFHKPRTNCTSGFGVCIKLHIEPVCVPCAFGYSGGNLKTGISNGKLTGWWKFTDDKIELHLPASIQQAKGYQRTDFSSFEVAEQSIFINKSDKTNFAVVKAGEYKVIKMDEDLVIYLDIVK